ncbi:PEPxxWA-CTERM sorting domain-containing protein [Phenylobacterium sp.]|uniref:PEPxxWA-CTERM sorting domain-containing protein n=1 Tax=Phenylobacterium sp. TaxID=1871053 RepID=UPI0025F0E5B7|nr:PEPxxWA-CTERM sorting domain-containing protein [Phenylobacterium sp.]MBX3485594.1 PEP-CTERM sorting domain-containing protein [Phenylobacterium sp.]
MRVVALAVASFGLLWGSSAMAQISNIHANAGSSYTEPAFACDYSPCTRTVDLGDGAGQFPPPGGETLPTGGASFNSFVDIGASAITFESSHAISQGPFTSFSSSSTVVFDFYTDSSSADFHSEITPQGLGFYLADTSGGCLFTNSCVQVSDELHNFGELNIAGSGHFLGGVGFTFEILDNESSIYTLSGLLILEKNPDCYSGYCFIDGLTMSEGLVPADVLAGFSQQTDPFDLSARAYGWGATDVNLVLDSGYHTIQYRTSVFSFTNADCIDGSICLIAYSGFGDPIGRGGAIDALAARGDVGVFTHQDGELIQGLNFSPQTFRLSVRDGQLDYSPGGVPEPGTWALMILGFGAVGAMVRRRRTALA